MSQLTGDKLLIAMPLYGGGQEHLQRVEAMHQRDLADGCGRVELPHALARKYPKPGPPSGFRAA